MLFRSHYLLFPSHDRGLRELIKGVEIFGQYSKANKMARILANSGLIKEYFYFPERPNDTLKAFMDQVISLTVESKDNDDAPDALAGLCAHLEKYKQLFKNQ